jgi:hypothetical protein
MEKKMKTGDICEWLDQGPALLLGKCEIPVPCTQEIKLLLTGEILDVHLETLDGDFIFKPEGIH